MEKGKYRVKISVDTSEVDEAINKLNQAAAKAKELKELLNNLQYGNRTTSAVELDMNVLEKAIKQGLNRVGTHIRYDSRSL